MLYFDNSYIKRLFNVNFMLLKALQNHWIRKNIPKTNFLKSTWKKSYPLGKTSGLKFLKTKFLNVETFCLIWRKRNKFLTRKNVQIINNTDVFPIKNFVFRNLFHAPFLLLFYLRCCSKWRKVVLVWLGRKSSQRLFVGVFPWLVLLLLYLLVLVLLLRVLELVLLLLQLDVGGAVPLVGPNSTLRSDTARQGLGRVDCFHRAVSISLEREASLRFNNAMTSITIKHIVELIIWWWRTNN